MNHAKKLIVVLVAMSLTIGVIWVLVPYSSNNTKHGANDKAYYSLSSVIENVEDMTQIFNTYKPLFDNIKATNPLSIWGKQYASETKHLLTNTTEWNTIGEIDEKGAGKIMSSATSTLEDRLYAMSMGYLSMFNKLISQGGGITDTIDIGKSSISGIDALIRARAGVYTLIDWKKVIKRTSTQAKVEFIRDISEDWESAYNTLKTILEINNEKEIHTLLDIGSTYIAIYNLKNISTNTYKNTVDILENKAGDVNISNLNQNTLMFMLYSAEYPRVGIEILSTLKQMEATINSDKTITKEHLQTLLTQAWKTIENTLNINLPQNPTSTTGLSIENQIITHLSNSYNFSENSIGYLLINTLITNYERYYKLMHSDNIDLVYAFYLTAQSKGIVNFITNYRDLAQGILLKAPTSTNTISEELTTDKLTFNRIYNWECKFAQETYSILFQKRNTPLIFDTFLSLSKIGYSAINNYSKLKETLNHYDQLGPLQTAKQMVGIYTRFMLDNLYTLFDILTINGALDILQYP